MKIRQEGTELFHADGRTDMWKLMVALRNLANASKNERPCKNMKAFKKPRAVITYDSSTSHGH
jgi:hypothetical protein